MPNKPIIFLSHSSKSDGKIANLLKREIETALDVHVFETSHPDTIVAGSTWFADIIENLEIAEALIVLVSPASRISAWVNFEIGYFWKINRDREKARKEKLPIFPLSIANEPMFGVLTGIEGKSLNRAGDVRNFCKSLSNRFDGDLTGLDIDAILAATCKPEKELTDEEIQLKLRDFLNDYLKQDNYHGRFVTFADLDKSASIPSGASKRFVEDVQNTYFPHHTIEQKEHGVIFEEPPIPPGYLMSPPDYFIS